MRAIGFGFVGLALGCIGGFWLGLMAGLICFEGHCGYVAAAIGALAAALCGLGGAIYGVRRGMRPEEAAAY